MSTHIEKAHGIISSLNQFINDSECLDLYPENKDIHTLIIRPNKEEYSVESGNLLCENIVIRRLKELKATQYPLLGIRRHEYQRSMEFQKFTLHNGAMLIGRLDIYTSCIFKKITSDSYIEITYDKRKTKSLAPVKGLFEVATIKEILTSVTETLLQKHSPRIRCKFQSDVTRIFDFQTEEFSELNEIIRDIVDSLVKTAVKCGEQYLDSYEAKINRIIENL